MYDTFNIWEKWFLHLAIILWESANKSPFSSFRTLRGLAVPVLSTAISESLLSRIYSQV
jgi:hypothetical protein